MLDARHIVRVRAVQEAAGKLLGVELVQLALAHHPGRKFPHLGLRAVAPVHGFGAGEGGDGLDPCGDVRADERQRRDKMGGGGHAESSFGGDSKL